MRKTQFCISFLLMVFSETVSHAWWDLGHEVVAQIARKELTEKAAKKVDDLLAVELSSPGSKTLSLLTKDMTLAAIWPDLILTHYFRKISVSGGGQDPYGFECHFLDLTLEKEELLQVFSEPKASKLSVASTALSKESYFKTKMESVINPSRKNILSCLPKAVQTLESSDEDSAKKALALRYLLHLMGDLHQPLHNFSIAQKEGNNQGGNRTFLQPLEFKLLLGKTSKVRNFHSLFDGMLGAVEQLGQVKIEKESDVGPQLFEGHLDWSLKVTNQMIETASFRKLKSEVVKGSEKDFTQWAADAAKIAATEAYLKIPGFQGSEEKTAVNASYFIGNKNLNKIVSTQIQLAGLRLGRLLNRIFN